MEMIKLLKRPLVLLFAIAAFMYVMTEQGIMSWLPTFNQKVLHLPEKTSVYMAIILMLSIALGRYISSRLVKRIDWLVILAWCLIGAALMVLLVLPHTQNLPPREISSLKDVPVIAYVFPLIGFFLAPIYPLVNSFVLSATEKMFHSPMASLLVFFSAVGGTLGSRLVGYLFKNIGGQKAFYFSLIPMSVLMICLFFFYQIQKKTNAKIEFSGGGHLTFFDCHPLFEDVQMNHVFEDGKTFPDCLPKSDTLVILQQYLEQKDLPLFNLKDFVLSHFDLPQEIASHFKSDVHQSVDHTYPAIMVCTYQATG